MTPTPTDLPDGYVADLYARRARQALDRLSGDLGRTHPRTAVRLAVVALRRAPRVAHAHTGRRG